MEKETYAVRTGEFEGSLELLLGMIEKREMEISDISLSSVADDYVAYIKKHKETRPGEMAQFIVVASTLLLIKSLSLLPNLELTQSEEEDIAQLEDRLRTYKRLKELSENIKNRFQKTQSFRGKRMSKVETVFSPHEGINISTLEELLKKCLSEISIPEAIQETSVRKVVSLEEMITKLYERIQKGVGIGFGDFSGYKKGKNFSKTDRLNVIVSFLALLELVKEESVHVEQNDHYSDIKLENRNI